MGWNCSFMLLTNLHCHTIAHSLHQHNPHTHTPCTPCWLFNTHVQVSPELRDLIRQLLDKDVLKRLDVQGALQVKGAGGRLLGTRQMTDSCLLACLRQTNGQAAGSKTAAC